MTMFHITPSAIQYSWRQVALRLGLPITSVDQTGFETLGVPVHYGTETDGKGPGLIVCRCDDAAWNRLLKTQENSLQWKPVAETIPDVNTLRFQNPIPILFWGKGFESGDSPYAEQRADGSVIFYVDIIATVFFMLSRWEETVSTERDIHGRFAATSSVAVQQGFLDIPIVDQIAFIVGEWIKKLVPGFNAYCPPLRVKPTHDIDTIFRFPTISSFVRSVGHALLRKRDISRALTHLNDLCTQLISPQQDLYLRAIDELANLSERHGFTSSFYFMATDTNEYQQGYDFSSSEMIKRFQRILNSGHEIGFHPGYFTFKNRDMLIKEKHVFESALGQLVLGGRQHYLRFEVPTTWKDWESAGFAYDSSMGYADFEGFRCGTCWPYYPFDIETDREIRIEEYPLIVMDATLLHYRHLRPEDGRRRMLELAHRCAEVGGVFTILWHNSSVGDEWEPWFNEYKLVLHELEKLVQ